MNSLPNRLMLAGLTAIHLLCVTVLSAHADVQFDLGATVFQDGAPVLSGPLLFTDDYSVPEGAGVLLFHRFFDTRLTVDDGSTLVAGAFLASFTDSDLMFKANIFVDGPASRIQIGSDNDRIGTIVLRGLGDFDITDGAVVNWIDNNLCNVPDDTCDILIGASEISDAGIRVIGPGSLLDASTTNSRLYVGYVPSPQIGNSDDFLAAINGGTILSNQANIGQGTAFDWTSSVGYVLATSVVDASIWNIQAVVGSGENSSLKLGEGSGATANLLIINGGVVSVINNPGRDASFILGMTEEGGVPTEGGTNLLGIRGAGSRLTVDNTAVGSLAGSRVANSFVTVQENGVLEIDSSILLISGKTGQIVGNYNTGKAIDINGFSELGDATLDVRTGGSVELTDDEANGFTALIIGQSPEAGPAQTANVDIASGGSIVVTNDVSQPKIPLDAANSGIPLVSNIGTGTMTISDGSLIINNGDFIIGVELDDTAQVVLNDSGLLTADRVVIGWADFETGGPGVNAAATGSLVLAGGVVNGDIYVDDNGTLRGVGVINGTVFVEGGLVTPGASPGTITVESFVLGAGSELVMELALNADGSINTGISDSIVATLGAIDLVGGNVIFELSSADPLMSVNDIVKNGITVVVTDVFESTAEVMLSNFDLTDPMGSISDIALEQLVLVALDNDEDGILDDADNCRLIANASQQDTDGDNFGNACDADFNQDCIINFLDLGEFGLNFLSTNTLYDLNADGQVNFLDYAIVAGSFLQTPGPSALADCSN